MGRLLQRSWGGDDPARNGGCDRRAAGGAGRWSGEDLNLLQSGGRFTGLAAPAAAAGAKVAYVWLVGVELPDGSGRHGWSATWRRCRAAREG